MSKKLKVGSWPRSDRALLDSLPQFQPDVSFDISNSDFETGEFSTFPENRESQLIELLSECMQLHAQQIQWREKITSLDRFVENARLAVAVYVYQRRKQRQYDRARAKKILIDAYSDIVQARETLTALSQSRELMHYLEEIYLYARKSSRPTKKISAATLIRGLREAKALLKSYSKIAPHTIAAELARLEPVIMLAAERVEYQAGDYQHDIVAQRFTDELAFAWVSGTGRIPTYSKPSPRLQNQSPFAVLLTTINKTFLDEELRSRNDFRDHAVKSVRNLAAKFPELSVRGHPPK